MGVAGMSCREEHRDVPVLSGAVPRPDLQYRHEENSNLLHDYPHHSMHPFVSPDTRLLLAAS